MKNLLFFVVLFSNTMFSQIKLESSFDGKISYFTDTSGRYYLSKGKGVSGIKIYQGQDNGWSLYKSFFPTLPQGSYLQILEKSNFNLTKHIFNSDDKLEIIAFIRTNLVADPSRLIIYNEDGDIVKDFGTGYTTLNNYALEQDDIIDVFVDKQSNRIKLKVNKINTNKTEIYDLGTSTLGIVEVNQIKSAEVYPNPTSSKLFITNPQNGSSTVEIFDLTGRIVMTKSISLLQNVIEIDVNKLPSGTYLYQAGNSSGKFIKK